MISEHIEGWEIDPGQGVLQVKKKGMKKSIKLILAKGFCRYKKMYEKKYQIYPGQGVQLVKKIEKKIEMDNGQPVLQVFSISFSLSLLRARALSLDRSLSLSRSLSLFPSLSRLATH